MKPKLLITQFKLDLARPDYESLCNRFVETIAAVPGLRWKIWTHDEAAAEAGGVYLFDTEAALNGFVESPIIAAVKRNPAFREVSLKIFDVLPGPTYITNGPIK